MPFMQITIYFTYAIIAKQRFTRLTHVKVFYESTLKLILNYKWCGLYSEKKTSVT